MKVVCVIPARYGSSRFPGKPLVVINGKTMVQWVYDHCKQVENFYDVVIATDDERIFEKVKEFGANVIMTPRNCPSPTERLFLVSQQIDADFYVMVNGDEPTLDSEIISKCIPEAVDSSEIYVRNLMTECHNPSDVVDSTNIKVVVGKGGNCMYMSRSPIPYPKGAPVGNYNKFLGVTGFTKAALSYYHDTPVGEVEKIEDIDELRFVENGKRLEFVKVDVNSLSVDSSKDVSVVEKILLSQNIKNANVKNGESIEKRWTMGDRTVLKDVVPIDTPISIIIESSGVCNFNCSYCVRRYSKDKQNSHMSMETFQLIVNQISQFSKKVKTITFAGLGEPTLNPKLPNMIAYLKEKDVCDIIQVVTNGSKLTHSLSDSLVESGLDRIRISVQSLDTDEWFNMTGYHVDIEEYVKNIAYFYSRRNQCKLFVKIFDSSLHDDEEKQRFKKIYAPICDQFAIEHLSNYESSVDGEIVNIYNEKTSPMQICPYPFFQMTISPNGDVYSCCLHSDESLKVGNVRDNTLAEIWGMGLNRIRHDVVYHESKCASCTAYKFASPKEDSIDSIECYLREKYKFGDAVYNRK